MTQPEPKTDPVYRQSNIDLADRVEITVEKKSYADIVSEAIDAYNDRNKKKIDNGTHAAMSQDIPDDYHRIKLEKQILNHILHNHSNFPKKRLLFSAKPGEDTALETLRIRTLDAIAQQYPQLEDIADDAIDYIFEQKDATIAANSLILEALPSSERKYVKRAMEEEVLLHFKPLTEVIPLAVAEFNLTHTDRRLQERSQDPRIRTTVRWETLHYIIRRHTNNNALCLAYRGKPHYPVAWDVIYRKTLDKVEIGYPSLAPMINAHRSDPKRPWTTPTTLLPWTRADGKSGEFELIIANLPPYLLSDIAYKTSGGDTPWNAFNVLTREFTNYYKIDKAIIGDGYKHKSGEVMALRVKVAAMKEIAKVHPRFSKNVEQALVRLDRDLKGTVASEGLQAIEDALDARTHR